MKFKPSEAVLKLKIKVFPITGKEKTVTALNTGKDVAIQTGTVGIGAAVIVSQVFNLFC